MNNLAMTKNKNSYCYLRCTTVIFFVLCVLGFTASGMSQSGTSSAVAGTITDSSKAIVAGAAVTAKEVNTGATRSSHSDTTGRFLFSQLNPGSYRM
jgi:hypothetical protein